MRPNMAEVEAAIRAGGDEPANVAYHEAGHAVATVILGLHSHVVSIIPDKNTGRLGHQVNLYDDDLRPATWADPDGNTVTGMEPDPPTYKAHIVGLYSGRAAEALLEGERDPLRAFAGERGDFDDRRKAAERIMHLWGSGAEHRSRTLRYQRLALWFVWRHRVEIERVAEALLRFGRLEMDDLDAAIEGGAEGVARFRALLASRRPEVEQ